MNSTACLPSCKRDRSREHVGPMRAHSGSKHARTRRFPRVRAPFLALDGTTTSVSRQSARADGVTKIHALVVADPMRTRARCCESLDSDGRVPLHALRVVVVAAALLSLLDRVGERCNQALMLLACSYRPRLMNKHTHTQALLASFAIARSKATSSRCIAVAIVVVPAPETSRFYWSSKRVGNSPVVHTNNKCKGDPPLLKEALTQAPPRFTRAPTTRARD